MFNFSDFRKNSCWLKMMMNSKKWLTWEKLQLNCCSKNKNTGRTILVKITSVTINLFFNLSCPQKLLTPYFENSFVQLLKSEVTDSVKIPVLCFLPELHNLPAVCLCLVIFIQIQTNLGGTSFSQYPVHWRGNLFEHYSVKWQHLCIKINNFNCLPFSASLWASQQNSSWKGAMEQAAD